MKIKAVTGRMSMIHLPRLQEERTKMKMSRKETDGMGDRQWRRKTNA